MQERVFVGLGFGAIQSGLFLFEAFQSRNFSRLVVAEVMPDVVATVRAAGGTYHLNVATATGIEKHQVTGIEILNPTVPADRAKLVEAIAQASELATALPSVEFFDRGTDSVARLLAEGLSRARQRAVLYAGENHNHAAEILAGAVRRHAGKELPEVQFLNTVIGKMSKVVTEAGEIATQRLAPVTPGASRAFLVEEFNRILISKVAWPDFPRGITVFAEKPDLLPFEEAKLYGHNAVHALLGYLANQRGLKFMSDCAGDAALMALAREAFLEESGPALIHRRGGVDALFTPVGYRAYAEDLLVRMVNPYLRDAVERVIRDPQRKLAWDDRLVGTMRLALDAGVTPIRFAQGAKAALTLLPGTTLAELWATAKDEPPGRKAALAKLIERP